MMGGNDYKIKSTTSEISNGTLKKEIWGIYQSDTLYLNSKLVPKIGSFSIVNELGRYDFVKFPFPASKSVQKELGVDFQSSKEDEDLIKFLKELNEAESKSP